MPKAMTALGHEERFPRRRLSGRCGFRKQSVAVDNQATWAFGSGSKEPRIGASLCLQVNFANKGLGRLGLAKGLPQVATAKIGADFRCGRFSTTPFLGLD